MRKSYIRAMSNNEHSLMKFSKLYLLNILKPNDYEKLISLLMCGLLLFGCSDKYDDSTLRNDLSDLENRVQVAGGTMWADEHYYFHRYRPL